MNGLAMPHVPVSWGELLDKVTILAIKRTRLDDPAALANVAHEHDLLVGLAAEATGRTEVMALLDRLRGVNEDLWEIEDAIRVEEERGTFGDRFIALARAVYRRNDERAALKRAINTALGSVLVEEKSYRGAAMPVGTMP